MTYLKIDKTNLVNLEYSLKREVIRTNRSGIYACTTIVDCNTRKYHGLFICPLPKLDGGRHVLLSGIDETVIQHDQEFNLALHKYAGDNYEPKGHKYILDFSSNPIPVLEYGVGGVVLSKEKVLVENESQLLIKYTLFETNSKTRIRFKPFLAFRNIHALSKANLDVNTRFTDVENGIGLCLYKGYPKLYLQFSKPANFTPAPDWYYNIEYAEDQQRGYEFKEDLYVPGFFEIDLRKGESIIFSVALSQASSSGLKPRFNSELKKRIPRNNFQNCLANSIQQFFVQSGDNLNIVAGYPWHPVRSRDALIALPGLTLPFYDEKSYMHGLKTLASKFKRHLINEIPDHESSGSPIDIPLWFMWSVQQYCMRYGYKEIWKQLGDKIITIMLGYLSEKQLFKVSPNGLLYLTNHATPNSWMNAQINNMAAIARKGFLVDINALWYNALCFTLDFEKIAGTKKIFKTVEKVKTDFENNFVEMFWNETAGYLNDWVSNDEINAQLRPNQLFAASLPYTVLNRQQIKCIVDALSLNLLTPFGLRTLAPTDENYIPVYEGDHNKRENAAFNGSVYPWLLAPYFEAMHKIDAKAATRMGEEYLMNFECELQTDGLCSISELYHGNPPQKAAGAISFAVNTGELIRLKHLIDSSHA